MGSPDIVTHAVLAVFRANGALLAWGDRFAARHRGSLFALMTAPGLWLQRITTQPPSDDQAECAIIALDRAMALEKEHGGELVIA